VVDQVRNVWGNLDELSECQDSKVRKPDRVADPCDRRSSDQGLDSDHELFALLTFLGYLLRLAFILLHDGIQQSDCIVQSLFMAALEHFNELRDAVTGDEVLVEITQVFGDEEQAGCCELHCVHVIAAACQFQKRVREFEELCDLFFAEFAFFEPFFLLVPA